MGCALGINIQSSEPCYFRFPKSATFELLHVKLCTVLGVSRTNCTYCLLWNTSALKEKLNKHGRGAVLLFTGQSSGWAGAGGPAQPRTRVGKLLSWRERGEHTVLCYRPPAARTCKAETQWHKNMSYEKQHVITVSLSSPLLESLAEGFCQEDNLRVFYLCLFSTRDKITQIPALSLGKNTSCHNAY